MRSATDELEAAALALPRGERARLAERPIASLDEDAETELEWANQVRRRLDAYRKGEMQAVDVDNVIAEARRRIGRG